MKIHSTTFKLQPTKWCVLFAIKKFTLRSHIQKIKHNKVNAVEQLDDSPNLTRTSSCLQTADYKRNNSVGNNPTAGLLKGSSAQKETAANEKVNESSKKPVEKLKFDRQMNPAAINENSETINSINSPAS